MTFATNHAVKNLNTDKLIRWYLNACIFKSLHINVRIYSATSYSALATCARHTTKSKTRQARETRRSDSAGRHYRIAVVVVVVVVADCTCALFATISALLAAYTCTQRPYEGREWRKRERRGGEKICRDDAPGVISEESRAPEQQQRQQLALRSIIIEMLSFATDEI